MPPSQLKQLKASLRDNGILGPQKSKKQRKANNKDAQKRLQRNAALDGIREKFNPFEAKAPARREKFDIASSKPTKRTIERPGVVRGLGEERRRATLLKEIQSRNKVGGMLDRRFGEDDPNMTPEQKAAERFAQQALRTSKRNNMFNLEEEDEEELQLTHGGRTLTLDKKSPKMRLQDDFNEDVSGSEVDEFAAVDDRPRKKVRLDDDVTEDDSSVEEEEEEVPQHKKTKNEVMQEVIAKSKAYKAARQAQKDDDDDLREELNKGMGDMFNALLKQDRSNPATKQLPSPPATDSEPTLNPSRAAMLAGKSREEAEKEYEANVRQMKMEARSAPSKQRTKSDEEKASEEKARLEELERKRIRRMKGEPDSSEDESDQAGVEVDMEDDHDDEADDAEAFGLEQPEPRYLPNLAVEDEDQFVMDDIIASESDADLASETEDDDASDVHELEDDGDDDFINGLVLPPRPPAVKPRTKTSTQPIQETACTWPCPQDLPELVEVMTNVSGSDLPTVVQRIRALYHKGLASDNEQKLGNFAQALVPWIVDLVDNNTSQQVSMHVVEQLLRHLHSMAKTQPHDVAAGFREFLRKFLREDYKSMTAGDLTILTAISTTFPTSDQWHSVVTPAVLVLARYLGQAPMESLLDAAKGAYVCSLALRYQAKSKRYVPETINFICKSIQLLAPNEEPLIAPKLTTPVMLEATSHHIMKKSKTAPSTKLNFQHLRTPGSSTNSATSSTSFTSITPESILYNILHTATACLDLYRDKSAYPELINPIKHLIIKLSHPKNATLLHPVTCDAIAQLTEVLDTTTNSSITSRQPLLLHKHRPLAIKSAYPLFTDNYNPTRKQRDPDEDRAEMNKLKAEHKKERKGAVRELRKDANFMAREQLREKKIRDDAYDKKFKRLVAEIQGEEGREAKEYERERAKRKGRF